MYFNPEVSLDLTPLQYHNGLEQVYVNGTKEYVPVENITIGGGVDVNQRVKALGGDISLKTNLRRYQSFGSEESRYLSYVSVPVNVSYNQNLFSPNTYKWKEKMDPLAFEKSIAAFVVDRENISITTIQYYFELLSQQIKTNLAKSNMLNDSMLYEMGQQRANIGSISKDELLKLELRKLSAESDFKQAELNMEKVMRDFVLFLELPEATQVKCELPADLPELLLNPEEIWTWVNKNSPELLSAQYQIMTKELSLMNAKRKRYNVFMNIDFGLNNRDGTLVEDGTLAGAYTDPQYAGNAKITVGIPILDWGKNKREIVNAKLQYEESEWQAQKVAAELKNDVFDMVKQFNIKRPLTINAAKQEEVAQVVYDMVKERFILGKVGVINLNDAQMDKDKAILNYLNTVRDFWNTYYRIRRISLYDFQQKINIKEVVTSDLQQLIK